MGYNKLNYELIIITSLEQWLPVPPLLADDQFGDVTTQYTGDYNHPRTGNPYYLVLNLRYSLIIVIMIEYV